MARNARRVRRSPGRITQQRGVGAPRTRVDSCASAALRGVPHGDIAPALPFSDSTALATRLLDGNYPHGRLLDEILFRPTPEAGAGRMPRGTAIDAAEQRELEEYFVNLAQSH